MPATYTFDDASFGYHMVGFLSSTPNSVMLGQNSELVNIAAIRNYDNGGAFIYMSLDIGGDYGTDNDYNSITLPFLRGALGPLNVVPEPSTVATAILGIAAPAGLALARRRRQTV